MNREFTIDRQPGAMVAGNLFPGRRADGWYFLGANWFFEEDENELTFDLSRLPLDEPAEGRKTDHRVRLPWDISC